VRYRCRSDQSTYGLLKRDEIDHDLQSGHDLMLAWWRNAEETLSSSAHKLSLRSRLFF
jgi:hypothetical protein